MAKKIGLLCERWNNGNPTEFIEKTIVDFKPIFVD
jgi:hypothetical protein